MIPYTVLLEYISCQYYDTIHGMLVYISSQYYDTIHGIIGVYFMSIL